MTIQEAYAQLQKKKPASNGGNTYTPRITIQEAFKNLQNKPKPLPPTAEEIRRQHEEDRRKAQEQLAKLVDTRSPIQKAKDVVGGVFGLSNIKQTASNTFNTVADAYTKFNKSGDEDQLKLANIMQRAGGKPEYKSTEDIFMQSPAGRAVNSPIGKKIISEVGTRTEDLGIKQLSKLESGNTAQGINWLMGRGTKTYDQALSDWKKSKDNPENGAFKKFLYGLQSSGPQTALGVILTAGTGYLTKSPKAAQIVGGSYYGAISANEQLQERGKINSPGNIVIDTVGDMVLSRSLESLFKAPAKSLLKEMVRNFGVEGGTEVTQSLAKFANDYKNAVNDEERQAVLDRAKSYVKDGEMIQEFAVGGFTGAGITAVAGTSRSSANTTNIDVKGNANIEEPKPQPEFPVSSSEIKVNTKQGDTQNINQTNKGRNVDAIVPQSFPVSQFDVVKPSETNNVPQSFPVSKADITKPVSVQPKEEMVKLSDLPDRAVAISDENKIVRAIKVPENLITVNNKTYQVTGESKAVFDEATKEYNDTVKELQKRIAKGGSQAEQASKQLKAEGMKYSALKRELTGSLTGIEIDNKVKYEQSNYIGKKVTVEIDGKEVEAAINSKPSFGRFKVKLSDGSEVSVLAKDITDKRTVSELRRLAITRKDVKEYTPPKFSPKKEEPKITREMFSESDLADINNESLKFVGEEGSELEAQYKKFKQSYGKFKEPPQDIAAWEKLNPERSDKLFNSSEYTGDEVYDMFKDRYEAELRNNQEVIKASPKNNEKPKVVEVQKVSQKIPVKSTPSIHKVTVINEKQVKVKQLASRVFERLSEEYAVLKESDPVMYDTINLPGGELIASQLIMDDSEKAYLVAMGLEPPPAGATSAQVNTALYTQAQLEGNLDLFKELVTNLTLRASEAGQFIVSLKGSVKDHSLAYYTKQLTAARMAMVGTNYTSNLKTSLLTFGDDEKKANRAIENGRDILKSEVREGLKKVEKAKIIDINEAQKLIDELKC